MTSTATISLAATIFILQLIGSSSDFLPPLLSPVIENVCKEVECGKGKCKASDNSTLFFECECDPGWKQTRSDKDEHWKFLPCIVPNCSMNYSCMAAAPAPAPDKSRKSNGSIFNPCSWTDCGGGSCNKTSSFTYNCECAAGYYNLLNVTAFPCFRDCAIGMDCKNLGISLMNKSASPPVPVLSDNGRNGACSTFQVMPVRLTLLVISLALIL